MGNKKFGYIDLYESYQIIGLVCVDFDETYPHQTENMFKYLAGFKDHSRLNTASVTKDNILVISLKNPEKTYCIKIETPRPVCIHAMAEIINLSLSTDIKGIEIILKNVFTEFSYYE